MRLCEPAERITKDTGDPDRQVEPVYERRPEAAAKVSDGQGHELGQDLSTSSDAQPEAVALPRVIAARYHVSLNCMPIPL